MTAATLPAHRPRSIAELRSWAVRGMLGPDPSTVRVNTAFLTVYTTRHTGRSHGYRNEILSLRVGAAVGSCGIEQRDDTAGLLDTLTGATVAELLEHPIREVAVAALDAYLMHAHPHPAAAGASASVRVIEGADSLLKSRERARTVVDLLAARPGDTVLVIGVVNSLLAELRARGIGYLACDRAGGVTEWGEPIHADAGDALERCDALLVTGMTVGNGTFDELLAVAVRRAVPLVAFAQTASAVLPWFLGAGVHAVSSEPYPFFALDGGSSTLYGYRAEEVPCAR